MMANLGGLLPSLIGPKMVTDPFKNPLTPKEKMANEIYLYMLMYLILSLILFIMFVLHFPDNVEDSVTVHEESHNVGQEFVQVLSSNNTILIILVISFGSIPHIWGSSLLTVSLSKLHITQEFIGYLTSVCLITSTLVTISLTRFADLYFGRNLKILIVSILPIHAVSMIIMSVLTAVGSLENNYQCKL